MKNLPKIQLTKKPTYIKFAEDVDFYELFQKIEQHFDTCFIFESLAREEKFSRYSLIGFSPKHIISAKGNTFYFDGEAYEVENPYKALQQVMPEETLSRHFTGGLIGYLSYEAINYFEPSVSVKVHELFDQFLFGVYTDGLILDKLTGEIVYFYYDQNRLDVIKTIAETQLQEKKVEVTFIKDGLTKKEHAEIVEKVLEEIRAGNTFQCEVGMKSEYNVVGDAIKIYTKLREVNPSPFMYYVKFNPSAGSGQVKKIIGASPELLFSLRDGEMTTKPLAGTIKRGKDEQEDRELARELLNNPKEKAEHTMIVDMHRNDLGRVAQFGSVKVRDLMEIKKLSHVQHIASEVVGLIRRDQDMFSGLASNFPMPTVCGTPRIETLKIIDRNESEARGPYGGAVGQFGFNGDCIFALAIRSFFISDTYGYAQTSGGIVYDSVAEKEYEEITNKLAAMKKVLSTV